MSSPYADAVASGRRAAGVFCALDGFAISHIIAAAGFDFVVFDRQHAAFNWPDLENMCFRVKAAGASPIIRTASTNADEVNLAFDLPIDGILLPNVASFEEAERAVRIAKLPPHGERSIGNERHDVTIGAYDAPEALLGFLIEHIGAVEAIDQILELPIDFIWVGTHDLAASMGLDAHAAVRDGPPPVLQEAIDRVRESAFAHGTQFWGREPGSAAAVVDVDARVVRRAFDDVLRAAREWL
jgi:4-hydroxy-2-oxoheptanedioate aldolase